MMTKQTPFQKFEALAQQFVEGSMNRFFGSGNCAKVVRVIHDWREEVGGGDDGLFVVQLVNGRIICFGQTHQQFWIIFRLEQFAQWRNGLSQVPWP